MNPSDFPSRGRLPAAPAPADVPPISGGRDALPPGTVLGDAYRVERVLGQGGFGIVYLATDLALQRPLAIKEYLPVQLAGRGDGEGIGLRDRAHKDTFLRGLQSFLREARLLAQFDHPSLVRVYRFWEQNHTAYMAMPHYPGRTLKAARAAMPRPPDERWLREQLLLPLLGALQTLHDASCLHRDVSPGNILLCDDGRPVLLDFGSARRVVSDMTQPLTAIVNPQYAAIEQYAESATLTQGPWTDLYGLAAVAYFALGGRPPVPATVRAVNEAAMPSLTEVAQATTRGFPSLRYSPPLLAALDGALAVRPADRPQSAAQLREALGLPHVQPDVTLDGPAPHPATAPDEITLFDTAPADTPAGDVPTLDADEEQAMRTLVSTALGDLDEWAPRRSAPPRIEPGLFPPMPAREVPDLQATRSALAEFEDRRPPAPPQKVTLKVVPGGLPGRDERREPTFEPSPGASGAASGAASAAPFASADVPAFERTPMPPVPPRPPLDATVTRPDATSTAGDPAAPMPPVPAPSAVAPSAASALDHPPLPLTSPVPPVGTEAALPDPSVGPLTAPPDDARFDRVEPLRDRPVEPVPASLSTPIPHPVAEDRHRVEPTADVPRFASPDPVGAAPAASATAPIEMSGSDRDVPRSAAHPLAADARHAEPETWHTALPTEDQPPMQPVHPLPVQSLQVALPKTEPPHTPMPGAVQEAVPSPLDRPDDRQGVAVGRVLPPGAVASDAPSPAPAINEVGAEDLRPAPVGDVPPTANAATGTAATAATAATGGEASRPGRAGSATPPAETAPRQAEAGPDLRLVVPTPAPAPAPAAPDDRDDFAPPGAPPARAEPEFAATAAHEDRWPPAQARRRASRSAWPWAAGVAAIALAGWTVWQGGLVDRVNPASERIAAAPPAVPATLPPSPAVRSTPPAVSNDGAAGTTPGTATGTPGGSTSAAGTSAAGADAASTDARPLGASPDRPADPGGVTGTAAATSPATAAAGDNAGRANDTTANDTTANDATANVSAADTEPAARSPSEGSATTAARSPRPSTPARTTTAQATRRTEGTATRRPETAARSGARSGSTAVARADNGASRRVGSSGTATRTAAAGDPRAACGDRTNFSLLYCMRSQCSQARYTAHPQCQRLRLNGDL